MSRQLDSFNNTRPRGMHTDYFSVIVDFHSIDLALSQKPDPQALRISIGLISVLGRIRTQNEAAYTIAALPSTGSGSRCQPAGTLSHSGPRAIDSTLPRQSRKLD